MSKWLMLTVLCCASAAGVWLMAAEPEPATRREQAKKAFNAGNFKDAYEAYRTLALDPKADPKLVGNDLQQAVYALQRLGRSDETDAFRDKVVELHQKNWRLLNAAAQSLFNGEHYGFIVGGEFSRGNKRGGGQYVNSYPRDRARGLQLLDQALPLTKNEDDHAAVAEFCLTFARSLLYGGGYHQAWRLQSLTDFKQLPDYEEGWYQGGTQGAPVSAQNEPEFAYLKLPESYVLAQSDGERWRWLLGQAAELDANRKLEARTQLADLLHQQFGVQTMAQYSHLLRQAEDADKEGQAGQKTGTFQLHTLAGNETIARLATGVQRFTLPDEFDFIRIYKEIADAGKSTWGEHALNTLAQIFSDRRQYPQAADFWRRGIKEYGPGPERSRQKALDQIVGSWGQFDPVQAQPAGTKATLEYLFRNGKHVDFEAHAIKIPEILEDVKAYLKKAPNQIDWNRVNIGNIGYRLVTENQKKYVGEKVAAFALDLEPRAEHFDKRVTVETPLEKAGAYLVTAKMADGNLSRIILWLNNTVVVKKALQGQAWYFVADAVTGEPVAKANVEFFGWQQKHVGNNQFKVTTAAFAEFSGAQGEVLPNPKSFVQEFQWLAIARAEGRFAFFGFSNVWYGQRLDQQYSENKVLAITDRPVYRPDQPVKFKLWIRKAQYDQADKSDFAHRAFNVQISNPQGEQVLKKTYTTDAYGGIEGEHALPKGAMLGQYGIYIVDDNEVGGGGNFRVEEYKKPEFEVTVEAPREPVMLGEKITATVQAKYFFGAPVVNAKVKYKILRNTHDERWYPVAAWDWFYGRGYWWFAYDYTWYPGWNRWGCKRPLGWWWPAQHNPPEVVAEAEVPIGPDGKIQITIDTALTKEVHGNEDHKYSITAEVTDESRRTIVGSGDVLVARQPFKVFTWVDRGFYRAGDVIQAQVAAHTLSQQPVAGKAELVLYQITYDAKQQPVEKAVEEWALETTAQGYVEQQIKAAQPGQYRLSCKVTDAKGHTLEGAYIFVVRGEGFDGEKFRFDNLELITDKKEYAPGETIKLMINTARANGTVALFTRPSDGIYLRPKILKLDGKSHVEEIAVVTKDMPNFFVEAITISDGELYTQVKEVAVPPAKRVLNVTVEPSAQQYKPGELAKVQLTLTDADGKPFQGSTVMTVYDKSIEYISGGSNVPEIKEFFWKWRRQHYPQTEHNLAQTFYNLLKDGEIGMSFLGAFGHTVADELRNKDGAKAESAAFGAQNRRDGGRMALSAAPGAPPQAAMAKSMNGVARELQASDAVGVDKQQSDRDAAAEGAAPPEMIQPTVRKNFADTAFWAGGLSTDKEGRAEIEFKMPEQLTGWKIKTWAMGHGTKVGQASVDVVTAKNLLVRMQAPRFFVETDEVVLSANFHNYLKTDKTVEVTLQLDGKQLETITDATQKVLVKAGGEERVDWRVKVVTEGEAVVRMQGLTDEESDAMEMKFPVYVHGLLKTESFAGVLRPKEDAGKLTFKVPAERRKEASRLEVRYSPTLAGALVDALPYLVDSPLENTECTLNRFLPTVITQNILLRMKLDLKAIQEKRTNLNAQEIGNDPERAKQWKRFDRNPVFDSEEVQQLVKDGVKSLTAMQLSDGGWGWFSGYGEHSWPHTTALVVHGLQVATQNEVALVPGTLEKGVDWLKRYQADQVQRLKNAPAKTNPWKTHADNLDALIYMVLADADVADADMREFLYRDRTQLAVYGLGLYGLALHKQGQQEKLAMILENISQYVVEDAENQTAYLKLPNDNYWWYWYGSDVEANAFYLKLLAKTDPQSPRAAGLVKYLLNNRKHATYWNSTRDTAFAIEALAEYLVASGEIAPDLTIEVWLDGKKQKEVQVNGDNLFSFDNQFVLLADGVETGEHTLEFKKKGKGPLYWNTYLTYFSLEDFITKAGLEIKVERTFYKLNRVDKEVKVAGARGQALDQKVEKYEREKLENLSTLKSGDLVEIELVMESKNDYEYLMFEDLKASGFEPVEVRSGYSGNGLGAYMQLRDERVQFFLRTIARGKHSLSYKLRAEIPGKFSALPATGSGVYAPELKANSDEFKVLIQD